MIDQPTRATVNADGEVTEDNLATAGGGVKSSADYQGSGVRVQRGIHGVTVQNPDQLEDSDMVRIGGVEMSVAFARSEGILSEAFGGTRSPAELDADLSSAAAAKGAEQETETEESDQRSDTGHAEFDAVVDGLNEALESEVMTFEEASVYETVVGGLALQGMGLNDALETAEGLADGTLDATEIDSETKAALQNAEAQITETATKAAQAELTPEGYTWLAGVAAVTPSVASAIREYAVLRATGKTDTTWGEFAESVAEHYR